MSEQDQSSQGDTGADDGGASTSFLDGIQNEELRGNEAFSGFENLDGLAEDYVNLKASQPKVPDSIEGYQFDVPEDLKFDEEKNPNGIQVDEQADQAFKTLMLENKVSSDQYASIMEHRTDAIRQALKDQTERVNQEGQDAINRRKESLGSGYDTAVENSFKAMSAFGAEGLKDDPAVANNDKIFNMLAKIGGAISEGKLNAGGDSFNTESEKGEDGKPMLSFPSMDKK